MSDDRQTLKQALKDYYAGKSLSDTQLDTLQKNLSQGAFQGNSTSGVKRRRIMKWASSLAASLFLLVMVSGYLHTPEIVTLANTDITKDANLKNGLPVPTEQWLNKHSIEQVPEIYPVKMSKLCRLGQSLTMHLRIAGKQQGEMNVFFQPGENTTGWVDGWLARSGDMQGMHWKLIKVRKNLSVIVLYTPDMRETAVQDILQKMLPELQV